MQCKDIPEEPILLFLAALGPRPATWFWSEDYRPDNSVLRAMPEGTPAKLGLAKMRKLIKRKLVAGCACGCRGDFRIPEIENPETTP